MPEDTRPDSATLALETLEQMANLPCADMLIWEAHANAVQSLVAALRSAEARIKELEGASLRLANAADNVGIVYFDTDDMSHEVSEMQEATLALRAVLPTKELPMTDTLNREWPHGWEIIIAGEVRKATVLCWDKPGSHPIVAYDEEGRLWQFDAEGRVSGILYLRNAPAPKRQFWVNVYEGASGDYRSSAPHMSEADAKGARELFLGGNPNWKLITVLTGTEGDGL